jgi:hypothetical protein
MVSITSTQRPKCTLPSAAHCQGFGVSMYHGPKGAQNEDKKIWNVSHLATTQRIVDGHAKRDLPACDRI